MTSCQTQPITDCLNLFSDKWIKLQATATTNGTHFLATSSDIDGVKRQAIAFLTKIHVAELSKEVAELKMDVAGWSSGKLCLGLHSTLLHICAFVFSSRSTAY